MESELLKIFDKNGNEIGTATRSEVHRIGHWHEAFHCWFVSREKDMTYIYLQLRSEDKKDYPNLLDITAAGHLLATETVYDGIREIKEEIGIDVAFEELLSVGIIKYHVIKGDFIDKELAHVYIYESKVAMDEFVLQPDEVSGIVKVDFEHFSELWIGQRNEVRIEGFHFNTAGEKVDIDEMVAKDKFVPHESSYYERVTRSIKESQSFDK